MSYVIVCVKKFPLDFSSLGILSGFIISPVFSIGLTGHHQKYLKPSGVYSVRRFCMGGQIEGEDRKSPPSRGLWNIVHSRWVGLH